MCITFDSLEFKPAGDTQSFAVALDPPKPTIRNNDGTTTYHYEIGFLLAGSYEAAVTCDGSIFEPANGKPAEISAQAVTTVDFP